MKHSLHVIIVTTNDDDRNPYQVATMCFHMFHLIYIESIQKKSIYKVYKRKFNEGTVLRCEQGYRHSARVGKTNLGQKWQKAFISPWAQKVKEGSVDTGSWSRKLQKRETCQEQPQPNCSLAEWRNWENKYPDLTFNPQITYQNLPIGLNPTNKRINLGVSLLAHRAR